MSVPVTCCKHQETHERAMELQESSLLVGFSLQNAPRTCSVTSKDLEKGSSSSGERVTAHHLGLPLDSFTAQKLESGAKGTTLSSYGPGDTSLSLEK